MGRLIVSEFVTLDGVIEAPGHEEHRDGRNAWALAGASEEQQRFKVDELFAADALLLGRVTFGSGSRSGRTHPRTRASRTRSTGCRSTSYPRP
jgi:dihydrofolate reductase